MHLAGPRQTLEIYGIRLVGMNAENAHKLLFSIVFILVVLLFNRVLKAISRCLVRDIHSARVQFWARQGINVATASVLIVGLVSIWFNDPARLATAAGLVTAGLAFALQRVITAMAAYLVILRGKTFNVGDRIMMGGVRGDVIALGFIQTTVMEMGQAPGEQGDDPSMWVHGRQYTGRVVTITNDRIFDTPVYNYTREFPYLWDEMAVPIAYTADRHAAERILLDAAARHTVKTTELAHDALENLKRRYVLRETSELEPRVFFRLTDNWMEMSVRFLVHEFGIRAVKDAMSRDIITALEAAGIGIASGTYDVVGMPTLKVQVIDEKK